MKNRFFAVLVIFILVSGLAFICNMPFGKGQTSLVVSNPNINGVYTNPVNLEYLNSVTSSSPIVLLISGFGKDYSEYATLQLDLANQGYVTISVSESHVVSSTDLTTTKKSLSTDVFFDNEDIIAILNWIGNNSLAVGNKQNIVLVARSTGGCASLIYNYLNFGVKGVCALSPAFNFTSVANNSYPVLVITAQGDTAYQPNSMQYYHELAAPKAYVEFKNGTHDLGIVEGDEGFLPNAYTGITEKYVLAFLSYATQNSQNGYNTISSAITDSNVLVSQNLLTNPSFSILPTTNPSFSPTPTPVTPEFQYTTIILLLFTATTLAVAVKNRRRISCTLS